MTSIAAIANLTGALAFAVLAALLAVSSRRRGGGRLLIVAAALSATWFGGHAALAAGVLRGTVPLLFVQAGELARDGAWFLVLSRLLGGAAQRQLRAFDIALGLLLAAALVLLIAPAAAVLPGWFEPEQWRRALLITLLLLALAGMVLVEQVFRATARDSRWALKHLCFGLGLVYAYDFYVYADAVLFNRLDPLAWSVRGLVNALAAPMIAVSAARNRQWQLDIFVSRRVVFHGVALLGAGLYLLTMAAAGYYLRLVGGEWGRALSTAFFSAALLVLVSLFFSVQMRSRLRLFLARHFYRNKYEYGEEWLRFTHALGQTRLEPAALDHTILGAVCDIVDSPGGVLWRRLPSGDFGVVATLSLYENCRHQFRAGDPLLAELEAGAAPVDLTDEARRESEQGAELPAWLAELPRAVLLLPMVHQQQLLAIVALARPRAGHDLDWEDFTLLGIVARQAASYLALKQATDALSEARQFETFNRLSAFLVHDLKNVVAQLSLIVSNARRHRANPEFVDDAFNTVGDAVAKMNRMLASLRQVEAAVEADEPVELWPVLAEAVASKAACEPCPRLLGEPLAVTVLGGRDRLLSVVQHLLQNAVEATAVSGRVEVALRREGTQVAVTIADTGSGMDREFIENRLFKPFDTTKGKAGMGIGAYESRHVISSMGGELRVDSAPGVGTTFTIVLPVADAAPVRTAAGN